MTAFDYLAVFRNRHDDRPLALRGQFEKPLQAFTTGNVMRAELTGEPMPPEAIAASRLAFERMRMRELNAARESFRRFVELLFAPLFYLWNFVLLALMVATLQGCTSFTSPAREVRVTEYSGNASPGLVGAPYVSGDLVVGGCRLVLSVTDGKGCLRYKGQACSYASQDCDDAAAESLP